MPRGDALEQFAGGLGQRAGGAAAVVGVIAEQLGAAVAQLPAVGGPVVDALDALRHVVGVAAEDDDGSHFHGQSSLGEVASLCVLLFFSLLLERM